MYETHSPKAVDDILYQTITVPINGETLHLQRIYQKESGPVLFCLHGSLGNGRVFYSMNGKGFGPFMARQGYDVYVGDLRGRGQSRPKISRGTQHGQTESIKEDLPLFHEVLSDLRPGAPLHWAAHSWGGALLVSYLARFPDQLTHLQSGVFFGSKRVIHRNTAAKLLLLTPIWDGFGALLVSLFGYFWGPWINFGDDAESRKSYFQTAAWLRGGPWIDGDDGFDYPAALQGIEQPPFLCLSGKKDTTLGAHSDVKEFLKESHAFRSEARVIGKTTGHRHDYGHLDIMTHPEAPKDHFLMIRDWLDSTS